MAYVLVTTEYRGVFFGETDDPDGETVVLRNLRNCIYWSSDVGGFGGLAATGPTKGCRIGTTVPGPVRVRKITSVADCTSEAVSAWKAAPVYRG